MSPTYLYSRHDLYSRKTFIHASADDMVGNTAPSFGNTGSFVISLIF